MVVCEEFVTAFVVVIVKVGCLFFFPFICFEEEMEKSQNKCRVEQPHSSAVQRAKASSSK